MVMRWSCFGCAGRNGATLRVFGSN
ncbi:MAG: hypothetical protein QOF35_697, partial [Actinomycetota bacterium]|nr:hypothetical protein [Actinomycetota bacterium]